MKTSLFCVNLESRGRAGRGLAAANGERQMEYVDQAWAFIQAAANTGLNYMSDGFGQLNWTLPILIAIYFAFQLGDWKKVFKPAVGATLLMLLLTILPLRQGEQLTMPSNLASQDFLIQLVTWFLAFVLMILFFFFLRKNVLGGGGGH
jgi:hypothetical protein